MAISDLFSKRQRRLLGKVPDVFRYDVIPQELRVQVIHILVDAIGNETAYCTDEYVRLVYELVCTTLCREYGFFVLPPTLYNRNRRRDYYNELESFLLNVEDTERVLDAIEISFRQINTLIRDNNYVYGPSGEERADRAIEELNQRFREHGIGYQFTDDELIRVDSALIHREVVIPALIVLRMSEFSGAQEEFLKAYEHYRHGNNKEAMNESLKCLESVLKAICDMRNWHYDKTATAKQLLDICFKNELIPRFWQSHYSSLRSLLESGVPTGRNKLSGHGQGGTPTVVPPYIVAYLLHMTASAVLFLANANNDRA